MIEKSVGVGDDGLVIVSTIGTAKRSPSTTSSSSSGIAGNGRKERVIGDPGSCGGWVAEARNEGSTRFGRCPCGGVGVALEGVAGDEVDAMNVVVEGQLCENNSGVNKVNNVSCDHHANFVLPLIWLITL